MLINCCASSSPCEEKVIDDLKKVGQDATCRDGMQDDMAEVLS
jgi:hypothetical protein